MENFHYNAITHHECRLAVRPLDDAVAVAELAEVRKADAEEDDSVGCNNTPSLGTSTACCAQNEEFARSPLKLNEPQTYSLAYIKLCQKGYKYSHICPPKTGYTCRYQGNQ